MSSFGNGFSLSTDKMFLPILQQSSTVGPIAFFQRIQFIEEFSTGFFKNPKANSGIIQKWHNSWENINLFLRRNTLLPRPKKWHSN